MVLGCSKKPTAPERPNCERISAARGDFNLGDINGPHGRRFAAFEWCGEMTTQSTGGAYLLSNVQYSGEEISSFECCFYRFY